MVDKSFEKKKSFRKIMDNKEIIEMDNKHTFNFHPKKFTGDGT